MRRAIWILILAALFLALQGCTSEVLYSPYDDTFRYNPDGDMSYFSLLGPQDSAAIPESGTSESGSSERR